jgi:hypothetical protein
VAEEEKVVPAAKRKRWDPVEIGAITAATGIATAIATVIGVCAVIGLFIVVGLIIRPENIRFMPTTLVMGLFIAIPPLLVALAVGAAIGPFAAWLTRSLRLPAIVFALIVAVLNWLAVSLPMVQMVTHLHDIMQGVVAGFRTIFELRVWGLLWPLAALVGLVSLLASLWATSRGFSIPLFSKSRWLQPLDGAAFGDKPVSQKEAEDR